ISIDPTSSFAYGKLGELYGKLGLYQEELEAHKKAVQAKPKGWSEHWNLAQAYQHLKLFRAAIDEFKIAVAIKPFFLIYSGLGGCYERIGLYEEAALAYKEAIRDAPRWDHGHAELAGVYDRLGRYDDALDEYKQAIQLNPDSELGHFGLGA